MTVEPSDVAMFETKRKRGTFLVVVFVLANIAYGLAWAWGTRSANAAAKRDERLIHVHLDGFRGEQQGGYEQIDLIARLNSWGFKTHTLVGAGDNFRFGVIETSAIISRCVWVWVTQGHVKTDIKHGRCRGVPPALS